MAGTVAWAVIGNYAIVAYAGGRPNDADFEAWCREYDTVAPHLSALLVIVDGQGADSEQRSKLIDLMTKHEVSHVTALVTESKLMRTAVGALNWFLPKRSHPAVVFATCGKALDFLAPPRELRARLEAAAAELQAEQRALEPRARLER